MNMKGKKFTKSQITAVPVIIVLAALAVYITVQVCVNGIDVVYEWIKQKNDELYLKGLDMKENNIFLFIVIKFLGSIMGIAGLVWYLWSKISNRRDLKEYTKYCAENPDKKGSQPYEYEIDMIPKLTRWVNNTNWIRVLVITATMLSLIYMSLAFEGILPNNIDESAIEREISRQKFKERMTSDEHLKEKQEFHEKASKFFNR